MTYYFNITVNEARLKTLNNPGEAEMNIIKSNVSDLKLYYIVSTVISTHNHSILCLLEEIVQCMYSRHSSVIT